MTRNNFFKTLVGVAAVGSIKADVKKTESLSGRTTPITPEDLQEYIDKRINEKMTVRISGKDLIAMI